MIKKLNGVTEKIKETAGKAKDVVVDNKEAIIVNGVAIGLLVGGVIYTKHNSKKFEKLWRAAKTAYENGDMDYDFGPYKVMKIFEPTGEFIGETLCHETATKAFLDLK